MGNAPEGKIEIPNMPKTIKEFRFKMHFVNGGCEGINPVHPPSLDPQIPMFMNFVLPPVDGVGKIKQVNLSTVRYMEVEITERLDLTI